MSNVESRMMKNGIVRANFTKRFFCHFQTSFLYIFLFLQLWKAILRLNLYHICIKSQGQNSGGYDGSGILSHNVQLPWHPPLIFFTTSNRRFRTSSRTSRSIFLLNICVLELSPKSSEKYLDSPWRSGCHQCLIAEGIILLHGGIPLGPIVTCSHDADSRQCVDVSGYR